MRLSIKRRDLLSTYALFGLSAVFIVGGIINFAELGWLTPLLEPFLALMALMAAFRARASRGMLFLAMGLIIYVAVGLVLAVVVRQVHALDFFQAYKTFWYLLLLVPIAGSRFLSSNDVVLLNKILLTVFLVIYSIKKFILLVDRPIVLAENNFELLLVCIVFYLASLYRDRLDLREFAVLGFIVFISGSRSSALAFAIVVAFLLARSKLRRRDLLAIGGLVLAVVMAYVLFQLRSRGGGIEGIDRVRFFYVFWEVAQRWDLQTWLLGEPRVSPLPHWACSQLSYYRDLFSYKGDGSCYAVILHSYNMRVIYEHGVVGLILVIAAMWFLLARLPFKVKLCMVALLLANGLSVSAINNVYFAIGLALVAGGRTGEMKPEGGMAR